MTVGIDVLDPAVQELVETANNERRLVAWS